MKHTLFILIFLILLSCSDKEKELKVFSPESFAFQLENGWELNSSFFVSGFSQDQIESGFRIDLTYSIDIIDSQENRFSNIGFDTFQEISNEAIDEYNIESQIVLDSTFTSGDYKIILHLTDNINGKTISFNHSFTLN